MKKSTKLKDLDHSQIMKLPDDQKHLIIKDHIKSARLEIINSVDIIPNNKQNTKLFNSLNYALMHISSADRELKCFAEKKK